MRFARRLAAIAGSVGLALLFALRAHAQDLTGTTWQLTSHDPADFVLNSDIPSEVGLGLIILRGRPGAPLLMVTRGSEEDPEKYGWDGTFDGTRLTFRKRLVNPTANESFTFDGQVSSDGLRISGTFHYYVKSFVDNQNVTENVVYTREGTLAGSTPAPIPNSAPAAPAPSTTDSPGLPPAPRLGPTDSPPATNPADLGTTAIPDTAPGGGALGILGIIIAALLSGAVLVKRQTKTKKLTPCQEAMQEFQNRHYAYGARVHSIRYKWSSQSANLRAEIARMDSRRKQLMDRTKVLQAAIKSTEREAYLLTAQIFALGKTGGVIREFGRWEAIKKLYELHKAAQKVGAVATAAEGAAAGSAGGLGGIVVGGIVAFGIYMAGEALEDAVTEMVAGNNIRALEKQLEKLQEVMSSTHPDMVTKIRQNEWAFRDLSDQRPELVRRHHNLTLQANAELSATYRLLASARAHALQVCGDINVSALDPEEDPIEDPDLSDPLQDWWGSLWAEPTDVVTQF